MDPVHGSAWFDAPGRPTFPRLQGDVDVDVAIVGAGITGLTAAMLAHEAGLRVAVLEARRIGAGTSGSTTAHLTAVTDARFDELLRMLGPEKARRVWDTNMEAIALLERLALTHGVACDFTRVPGALWAARPWHARWIARQLRAAARIGVPHEERTTLDLPFPIHRALWVPDQARVHPMKLLWGLADALGRAGQAVHETTRVIHVEHGERVTLTTAEGRVTARHVLLATHSPIGRIVSVHARMEPQRSYAIAVHVRGDLPEGLYWNSETPYVYVRRQDDLLIVGGGDHKTGAGSEMGRSWDDLEAWTKERFDVVDVAHRWSANLYEAADGLPYIGPVPGVPNVFLATGYAGNGMTFGTAAARVFVDRVVGAHNPFAELYAPTRVRPRTETTSVLKENVETAWHFLVDRLRPSEAERPDDVPAGEGRLVKVAGRTKAVYREPNGTLHTMSAVCTHLGCVVQWNPAESSWDCPCHGGRYTATGEVLDGPPVRALHAEHPAAPIFVPEKVADVVEAATPPDDGS